MLVQTAELVDLVLVFAANLDFVARCLLVFPRQLWCKSLAEMFSRQLARRTIRLFILGSQPADLQDWWFNSMGLFYFFFFRRSVVGQRAPQLDPHLQVGANLVRQARVGSVVVG